MNIDEYFRNEKEFSKKLELQVKQAEKKEYELITRLEKMGKPLYQKP